MRRYCVAPVIALTIAACMASMQACAPAEVGQIARPPAPTVKQAMHEACKSSDVDRVTPLVIDWESHERGDLEEAMDGGVAVVHYDCDKVYALPRCSVPGRYGFIGMERKEDVLQLRDGTEIRANLPALSAKFSAEIQQDSALDVALVLIGKRRTTLTQVASQALVGSCAGATHFVRGAYLGASAFRAGTAGKIGTRAEIFSAEAAIGANSSLDVRRSDGDPERCAAPVEGSNAPSGCASVLRLELYAIDEGTGPATVRADVEAQSCPEGTVPTGGKCVESKRASAYECKPEDPAECRAQCARGNLASCAHLAFAIHYGNAGPSARLEEARDLYEKACDGGVLGACTGYGVMLKNAEAGLKADRPKAYALHERACKGGNARGCNNLAVMLIDAEGVKRDVSAGLTLLRRACDGGSPIACGNLGFRLLEGTLVRADASQGLALLKQACFSGPGGAPEWCATYGEAAAKGGATAPDPASAARAFAVGSEAMKRACDAGNGRACEELATYYLGGYGRPRNVERVAELEARSCELGLDDACYRFAVWITDEPVSASVAANGLKIMQERCSRGGTCEHVGALLRDTNRPFGDPALSFALLTRACERRDGGACIELAQTYVNGRGAPQDDDRAFALRVKACELDVPHACFLTANSYVRGVVVAESRPTAIRYYDKACKLGHGSACERLAELGE
jgi:uncharacterized protein